jgi:hypothetical protein
MTRRQTSTRCPQHRERGWSRADLTLVVGTYLTMGRFMQVLDLDQACNIAFDADG